MSLHVHSEYSSIDGVSKIEENAQRMVEIGCPCCSLTDHGVVAGHLELAKVSKKYDLKPIFGCELYHGVRFGEKLGNKRDQAHLIALAMTDEGLKNLWRLNDAAAQEPQFHHVGRVSWDNIKNFKEGIVFTSACALSLVSKGVLAGDNSAFDRYLDVLGDNFYIELSTYPGDALFLDKDSDEPIEAGELNRGLANLAQERGIPLVYGDDGHYAFPSQYRMHDAYVARSTGQDIYTPIEDRKMWHPEGALCIKDEYTVRKSLDYLGESIVDECISNAKLIGERASATLPEVRRHLPIFIPDASPWVEKGKYKDDEADKLFIDLVEQGMEERYGEDPDEQVVAQTMKEAEIFLDPVHGLFHYFLLGWDVMQFCDHAHEWLRDPRNFGELQLERLDEVPARPIERGPGRGSSAGCIIAFELGITDINPLPYDLIFERFWNPGRAKGFPDIDSDFEKSKRYLIKRYISYRWGHDRVRSIGTVTRMKPKSVIETMWGACGVTFKEAEALKKIVEKTPDLEILGVDQIGWSREVDPGKVYYVWESVGEQIVEWIGKQPEDRQDILVTFIELCEVLCNRVSNYGVHASGIVVSDADLSVIAPCRFAGSPDQRIPVTQFAMDDIDALLLIKFDALGLRTLDVLSDWKAQLKANYGIDLNWSQLEHEEHPIEMWQLLWRRMAAGIFQLERGLPVDLAEAMEPTSVEDLSALVALNRPGPIRSGAPDSFIKRKRGEEPIAYDDAFLEDILHTTFGWFLYQESVIRFFGKLGFTDSDADAVRKILGKKQPEKWLDMYHGRGEWEGKGYIEMAAKAGIGDISKTSAVKWEGEDTVTDDGLLYRKDSVNAWIIWAKIVDFAKYSFNKSHSVAYATIAFRALFAKYTLPSEFYMAAIRHVDKNKKSERIPAFIGEARRWGIKVFGPDIEHSKAEISVHEGNIYFGFNDVKNVSARGAYYLVELRDLGVDVSSPEALDAHLEKLSKERSKENALRKKLNKPKLEGKSPKQLLNSGHLTNLYTAGAWERIEGYPTPMHELQDREEEMLSVILSDNTQEAFDAYEIEIAECDSYEEAKEPYPGCDVRFRLAGAVTHVRETRVKATGKKMGIVTIGYGDDTLEFAVFPDSWRSHKFLWRERTPGIFKIKHSLNQKTGKTGYHFESGQLLQT